MKINYSPINNVISFSRDPISLLCSLTQRDITTFPMAHLRFHHITGLKEIKQVLVYDQNKFVKTPQAQYFTSLALGEGLVSTDGEKWAQRRKEANPVFTNHKIDELVKDIVNEVNKAFDNEPYIRKSFQLFEIMMEVALQLICKLSFGFSDKGHVQSIGKTMHTMIVETYKRIIAPVPLPLFIPTASNIRFNKSRKQFDDIIMKMTQKAFELGNKDALALKYSMKSVDEMPKKTSIDNIAIALKTIIAAGHETTATTLTWLLFEISKHPEMEATMKKELRTLNLKELTKADDLFHQTAYTQLVINETLRMYPPIWLMGRMAVEPITIGDKKLRKNDNVLISPFVVHRLEQYWEEPNTFNPERFRNKSHIFTKSAYFPFGLGPRQCIGGHLAMVEMLVILATLYQRFELKVSCKETMEYHPFITLRPSKNIFLELSPVNSV